MEDTNQKQSELSAIAQKEKEILGNPFGCFSLTSLVFSVSLTLCLSPWLKM